MASAQMIGITIRGRSVQGVGKGSESSEGKERRMGREVERGDRASCEPLCKPDTLELNPKCYNPNPNVQILKPN